MERSLEKSRGGRLLVASERIVGAASLPLAAVGRCGLLASASGVVAWLLMEAWQPDGRLVTLVASAVVTAVAFGAYALGMRATGGFPARSPVGAA